MTVFAGIESINVVVVGASQGIGLGFVRHLLRDDRVGQVYATYRNWATTELSTLLAQYPNRLGLISMDISDEAQIAQEMAQLQRQIDKLHLVFYCVGFLHEDNIQPEKSLQQIRAEHLLRYFQVNSIGAVLLAKHLLPLLKHGDKSVFASISAKVGSISDNQLGGWYGYRASKAALNMFMRTVRRVSHRRVSRRRQPANPKGSDRVQSQKSKNPRGHAPSWRHRYTAIQALPAQCSPG